MREGAFSPGTSWSNANGWVTPMWVDADWLRSAYTPVSPMARAQNSATMRSSGRVAVRPRFSLSSNFFASSGVGPGRGGAVDGLTLGVR